MQVTELKIINALSEVLKLPSQKNLTSEMNLREDLGLDSMTSLLFLMRLEETIEGFIIDPVTLDNEALQTVGSITDYVKQQLLSCEQ